MSKEEWDSRFAAEEYIYGTKPNAFFKQEIDILEPGNILLPAEGEGRNAVYAAEKGWQVAAFDQSAEGRKKALKLANERGVEIDYRVFDFKEADYEPASFDALALIYVHLYYGDRLEYFTKFLSYLKPGGTIIMEVFSKEQIKNDSGGPKEIDRLYTKQDIETLLSGLKEVIIEEKSIILSGGAYHSGEAAVIRAKGIKA